MIPELRDLSKKNSLIRIWFDKIRRLRGDQVDFLKIVNDYEDIDMNMFS